MFPRSVHSRGWRLSNSLSFMHFMVSNCFFVSHIWRLSDCYITRQTQQKYNKALQPLATTWPEDCLLTAMRKGAFPLRSAHKWPQRKSFYDLSDQSLHNADHLLLDKLWLFYTGPQHISQDKCGPGRTNIQPVIKTTAWCRPSFVRHSIVQFASRIGSRYT